MNFFATRSSIQANFITITLHLQREFVGHVFARGCINDAWFKANVDETVLLCEFDVKREHVIEDEFLACETKNSRLILV